MFLKKIIVSLILILFLNGCAESLAFLGPIFTGASTGSASNAGVSYGTSKAIKKITGKTTTENVKSFIDSKKPKVKEEEYYESF